jgi:formate dehydrogenase major subunit
LEKLRINIDGREVLAFPGQTILEVARACGIDIPTLCYDDRTEIYGACGLCVVEVDGNPKLVKACATVISQNMAVRTDSARIRESRKTNLELLLSNHVGDCRPPCALACPAGTDCQGYVGLIANGEFGEAIKLVKDKIPLPASIGRVCPHPCETKCRRGLVDEPIAIAWQKRFVADFDLQNGGYTPDIAPETGKTVAIVGGGPYGLSLAYFLRRLGHDVAIYDAMPKLGGMLRYGIPEYRLPKSVLDEEIELIASMGVELIPNTKIGADISFDALRDKFDAVAVGIGAWVSTGSGCPGEDADGVIGGIDLLRKVVKNEGISLGRAVAVVGGGNTAMDACRTAVRLGAEKVYNIYRRTKNEMPADHAEIEEAEEEGVIFKNLTNPLEIVKDERGHVKQVILQVMELGEPDASGRRAPVPVDGKTETIDVDNVVLAIGQAVSSDGFSALDKTRKKGIAYDPETFVTSIPGVFAGGDCGNDKISIAVEAIGDAQKTSAIIDKYLRGESVRYKAPYTVERDDITDRTFEDRERECRPEMEQLTPDERRDNFEEVVFGYTADDAMTDAQRCLECGCGDYFECKLVRYSNEYNVKPSRFAGEKHAVEFEDKHPLLVRDPNKCILCGLCVRVCAEIMGIGALGLVDRGFDAIVKPALERPLCESGCISCGQCVSVCPTGALQERLQISKPVPLRTDETCTTCSYCSVGCSLKLETCGDLLIKSVPDMDGFVNRGLICGRGKFGFDLAYSDSRLTEPLIRAGDALVEGNTYDAVVTVAKKITSIGARHGRDAVAFAVSDRYTNEEAYAIKKLADKIGARVMSFNNRKSGLEPVLSLTSSPNTINELLSTDVIIAVGVEREDNPVLWMKMNQAAKNGAKVVCINPEGTGRPIPLAYKTVVTDNTTRFLGKIAATIIAYGAHRDVSGLDEFTKTLPDAETGGDVFEIADIYCGAKKAMIVYRQNTLSVDAATLLADIALLSGHIGSPRDGILQVKAKNNSQGINDMGITDGEESLAGVKALLVFGENPKRLPPEIEFLFVSDTHLTDAAQLADVVIPALGFEHNEGTYTNTERRLLAVNSIPGSGADVSPAWEIASEIAYAMDIDFGWDFVSDIAREIRQAYPAYRDTRPGEVMGGAMRPVNPRLVPVATCALVDRLSETDHLLHEIDSKLTAVNSK